MFSSYFFSFWLTKITLNIDPQTCRLFSLVLFLFDQNNDEKDQDDYYDNSGDAADHDRGDNPFVKSLVTSVTVPTVARQQHCMTSHGNNITKQSKAKQRCFLRRRRLYAHIHQYTSATSKPKIPIFSPFLIFSSFFVLLPFPSLLPASLPSDPLPCS